MKMNIKTIAFTAFTIPLFFCSCSNTSTAKTTLKSVSSFPVGTAININKLKKDSKLQHLQIENFNSITATYEMKMDQILKINNNYNWETVDSILKYAETYGQRLFGHTLIWHSSTPQWVLDKGNKDSLWLKSFMKTYIHDYVSRYKGKVSGWDVVNEAFESEGGNYRKTFWYNKLGKEYIEKAFIYAHQANPDAILFYNDFNIERDILKLNAVLKMIDEFKAKNIPISGIGFQMHIRMDVPDDLIASSLKKAAATGLQIHISELDIIFNKHDDAKNSGKETYTALTEEMKKLQFEKYKKIALMYREIVPKQQQYGITVWDFTDRDTWIRDFFGIRDWPSLFDDNLEPKPAYFGFKEGLEEPINLK